MPHLPSTPTYQGDMSRPEAVLGHAVDCQKIDFGLRIESERRGPNVRRLECMMIQSAPMNREGNA
jgi:hypothetical protein